MVFSARSTSEGAVCPRGKDVGVARREYTHRRAFESGAFLQNELIEGRKFCDLADKRGIKLGMGSTGTNALERFDREGALRPIAFVGEVWPAVPAVYRDEVDFAPWNTYAVSDGHTYRPVALYSPWQLLYVKEARDLGTAQVDAEWLLDTKQRRRLGKGWRGWYERQLEARANLDDRWREIIRLLTRIQNRYLPSVRGTLTTRSVKTPFDHRRRRMVEYDEQVLGFDPRKALRDLGLKPETIKESHRFVMSRPAFHDPIEAWSTLVRMAPFTERQKLKGDALLAHDAYDAGEMLRYLYHDLTGELLHQPDELFDVSDGAWRERIYGHPPRLRYTRDDLKAELQRHGLYPHLIHLVVEGPSDRLVFERLLEFFGLKLGERGVSISEFKGVGNTDLRTQLLRAAKESHRFPILVSDREGDIEREAAILQEDGLLSDETTFIWKRSLEEDNFSDAALVRLAKRAATRRGGTARLTGKELRKSYNERLERSQIGLAEHLLKIIASPACGSVRLSKLELADEIARQLTEEMSSSTDLDSLAAKRPVIKLILAILRST